MVARETTLKEVGEMLGHVVKHMATKEDLGAFRLDFETFRNETNDNFRAIRAEVADIRRDLEDLRNELENVIGYRKEIDHALERIAVIEKHLNLRKKMAA